MGMRLSKVFQAIQTLLLRYGEMPVELRVLGLPDVNKQAVVELFMEMHPEGPCCIFQFDFGNAFGIFKSINVEDTTNGPTTHN